MGSAKCYLVSHCTFYLVLSIPGDKGYALAFLCTVFFLIKVRFASIKWATKSVLINVYTFVTITLSLYRASCYPKRFPWTPFLSSSIIPVLLGNHCADCYHQRLHLPHLEPRINKIIQNVCFFCLAAFI